MLCATEAPAQTPSTSKSSAPELTGTWTSAPNETPLSTDFDRSVWGPNARSVRDVQLRLDAAGQGTLTVTKRVLDAKNNTVAGSASVEEARLMVGGLQKGTGPRAEYAVTVQSAERRYPDDKEYKWPIEGLRVRITAIEGADGTIEIRYDTPEGRGSFWETLRRQGRRPAQRR
jgi:hypothetical protein